MSDDVMSDDVMSENISSSRFFSESENYNATKINWK
jgi:hypothetical protein